MLCFTKQVINPDFFMASLDFEKHCLKIFKNSVLTKTSTVANRIKPEHSYFVNLTTDSQAYSDKHIHNLTQVNMDPNYFP
jgi:hypothetical protein